MLEVEVFGASLAPQAPSPREIRRLCERAAAHVGIEDGHVAVEFVDAQRIAELNAEHRHRPGATDVLSFPIDGVAPVAVAGEPAERNPRDHPPPPVPRELGDIVVCPERTAELREAIVHGMLHLLGMDHETDSGEMLALQRELLAGAGA